MSEPTVLKLFNPLKETFTFRWDKVPYSVPGKTGVQFPAFIAKHGAKHLVDFIILHSETWPDAAPNRGNTFGDDLTKGRDELLAKVLLGTEEEKPVEDGSEEKEEPEQAAPRRGRPPKEKVEDEEFSDAKNLK